MSVFVSYKKIKTVALEQKILSQNLQTGERALLQGFAGGAFSQFLAHLDKQPIFVFTEDLKIANRLQDEIRFFAKEKCVKILRPFDVLPYYGLSPHQEVLRKTITALHNFLETPRDIFLIPKQTLFRRHFSKQMLLS